MSDNRADDKAKSTKPSVLVRALAVAGAGTILVLGSRFLLNFFGPAIAYSMHKDIVSLARGHKAFQAFRRESHSVSRFPNLKRLMQESSEVGCKPPKHNIQPMGLGMPLSWRVL